MLKHRGRASFSTKIREFIRQHEALTRVSQAQEAPAKPEVTLIDWPPATQVRITREAREAISREISYRTTRERECVETGGYLIADKSRYGLIIQATGPGDDSFHTPDMVSIGGPEEAERIVAVPHTPPQDIFPGRKYFSVSPANYYDWKAQNTVFSNMAMAAGGVRMAASTLPSDSASITSCSP